MKAPDQNPISSIKVSGAAPVTREMVHRRTRELTVIAGRDPRNVRQADYEQAKRELTGESDGDRQQAVLDALPSLEMAT
jgi:hypothetical protein